MEILRISRISNDVEQSSGTLCKPVGRSNVFACASSSLRNVFRVLRTDNNNIYLFSYIYVVRTGLSEKSSTLLQTIGTWKSYKSVDSNRVGWFRTGFVTRELTQRSVHRVRSRKFDGCVAKRQENFIRFEMCVSKSRSQQVSFELVSWLHKRLTLVPSCIDIVKLGCRYCAIEL